MPGTDDRGSARRLAAAPAAAAAACVLAALALLAVAPAPALALKSGDPGGGTGGGGVPTTRTLTITIVGGGSVKNGTQTLCTDATDPCSFAFPTGSTPNLAGYPTGSGESVTWSGACSGSGACSLTMDADKSVTATFHDVTPPPPPTITSPAVNDGDVPAGSNRSFSFTTSGDTAASTCRIDSGSEQICTSGVSMSTAGLTLGRHAFRVSAYDPASNASEATRTFIVTPTSFIAGTPLDGTTVSSRHTAFDVGPNQSGSQGAGCKLDGPGTTGTWDNCPALSGLDVNPPTDGTWTLSVFSYLKVDGIFHSGPTVTRTWTVDATPPDTILGPGGPGQGTSTTSTSAAFEFTSTEVGSTLTCALDGTTFGPCPGGTPGQATYANLAPGTHTFRVKARDGVGNEDDQPAERSWTIVVDNDGDGFEAGSDCNDSNAAVHPGATDIPGNGVDEDCSGADATVAITSNGGATENQPGGTTEDQPGGTPSPPTLFPSVGANVSASWKKSRKSTRVQKLTVSGVPAAGGVKVLCSGKGCPFSSKAGQVKNGTADLTKLFKNRKLMKGALIEVQITRPLAIGKVVRYEIKPPRAPSASTFCLPPSAPTARAC